VEARSYSRFHNRANSAGRLRLDQERRELLDEIERLLRGNGYRLWKMDRSQVVISTNMPLRQDGEPRAGAKTPADPGVAVYFKHGTRDMVFACDRWWTVPENLRAITKTIEAIRGMDRWGVASASDRAFTGFEALPSPDREPPWWEVLGVDRDAHPEHVRRAYRELRSRHHPDKGGSAEAFNRIAAAWSAYETERGIN
jgi:hypothetical protein